MHYACSLQFSDGITLDDITLGATVQEPSLESLQDGTLQFLSIVETAQIPLYLAVASPLSVSTQSPSTEQWFSNLFLGNLPNQNEETPTRWWESYRPDSPFGILVSVQSRHDVAQAKIPRVTEVLFYASSYGLVQQPTLSPAGPSLPENGALSIKAVALSSDLICQTASPPPSPVTEHAGTDGVFLASKSSTEALHINEPPVRKRKSATDAFDEANERRKKSRRKGGEGVSATAASKIDAQPALPGHRRQSSDTHRGLSRSPSIASSRPTTAVAAGCRPSTYDSQPF